MNKPSDLEERLVDFAVMVMDVVEGLPDCRAASHIAGQLIRSGTSPAPNYGEARGAESMKDFIHKLRIALKELRESSVWLRILARKGLGDSPVVMNALAECDELIAIFVSSIRTAESKPPRTS